MQFSTSYRNTTLSSLVTALGPGAFMLIYSGAVPASTAAAPTGVELVPLALSNPVGTVSAGVLTFSAVSSALALASGTAGYYRLCTDATGAVCVAQGPVGTSGAELNFPSGITWTSGTTTVMVTSFTVTAPGA